MISLDLCEEIYSLETIKEAKEAYDGLADIKIIQNDGFSRIMFQHCRYGEEMTAQEFENYLIGLENS